MTERNDVLNILREHEMILVHMSGCPKGTGNPNAPGLYPADLKQVIAGKAQTGVSCSTICATDCFEIDCACATGYIGLILDIGDGLVVDTHFHDCGSFMAGGIRTTGQQRNGINDIEDSINNRPPCSYNEWVVKDFKVLGVIAIPPFTVTGVVSIPGAAGMPAHLQGSTHTAPIQLTKDGILDDYNDLGIDVYTIEKGQFAKIVTADRLDLVTVSDIYKL